jgi:uncharacterized protein (DUF433 family)
MKSTQKSAVVLAGPNGEALIRKTPDVCGGDACVGNTRIMVWLLVAMKQAGQSDEEILRGYPTLKDADLAAAWEYYRQNQAEIDQAIASQEDDE